MILGGAFPGNAPRLVDRAFRGLRKGKSFGKKKTNDAQGAMRFRFESKQSEASNIILGFRAFSLFDSRKYAIDLLGTILGGNSSSRLYMEIREKRGLAYYVRAGSTRYTDSGYFDISAGVPHKDVASVIQLISDEIVKIKKHGVTKDELQKAKDFVRGHTRIDLEDSSTLTSFFGEQALFQKKILSPDDFLRKIDAVTVGQIQNVVKTIFLKSRLNTVLVGKLQEKNKIMKALESF